MKQPGSSSQVKKYTWFKRKLITSNYENCLWKILKWPLLTTIESDGAIKARVDADIKKGIASIKDKPLDDT